MNATTIKPSQCASDMQMAQRSSWIFRTNVITNTIIAVMTLVSSIKAYQVLKKDIKFSDSACMILKLNLVVVNLHQVVYGYIQLWSLYRSIQYYNDPCSIMFNEYECFPLYRANIASRLMILFTLCALTLDMVLSCLPRIKSTKKRGIFLFIIAIVCSTWLCQMMTADGPNANIQANCYQRLNRDTNELKVQIYMYLIVIGACFVLDTLFFFCHCYIKRCWKKYNVAEQFKMRVAHNTTIAISVIVFLQLVCMGSYTFSIHLLIDNGARWFGSLYVGNLVLWCYTYPFASLSMPIGILVITNVMEQKRNKKMKVLRVINKNEKQSDHFQKLTGSWDSQYNNGQLKRNVVTL